MKRMTAFIALAICIALLSSCGMLWELGDGNLVVETRSVEGAFSAVDLSGTIDIDVVYGETPAVIVKVDENLQDKVFVSLEDGTLRISEQSFPSIWASEGSMILVTTNDISALNLTGTGNLSLSGFNGLASLSVSLTGTGNCVMSGSAQNLDLDLVGTGNIEASEAFSCVDADIDLTGTGNLNLEATGAVTGSMTGTGNLELWGGATVSVSNTGTGSIRLH